ncbi:lysophospholipid acyltransferase family protein [Marinomonas posidonica]|uniref:Phospholipid/glycerol acyltransferase n=1 Tax=Marinomonas posidonica (strain CECT 7376 / NCIMB 14433 / IVIA-Po-181) TaxID=491952 RepID=F6CZV7_MARPP|nr:lysophospholipid acyltransferase family protein [Marinomonas posidonica]AEF53618.1 phospholipid/glycerol acyltransferase [Marinomonas posidonica IVIA-Po-181]
MFKKLEFGWRWFATAFSFFAFGIGGIALGIVAFPILRCLPISTVRRTSYAKRIIHSIFNFYIKMMRYLGVLTYEVKHIERLKNAPLVLANHPSLIDVIFLIALIPNANCVVKGKLTRNIFTRGPIKMAGYIINDENEHVINNARNAITQQDALIVFPEGTRSIPNQPVELKRGASQIALRVPADITPVVIQSIPSTLTKQDRWYQIPSTRVHFTLEVKPVISIQPYLSNTRLPIAARRLSSDLATFFNEELKPNV